METINNWIYQELNKRHWSQAELARKCGVTTATISRIMTGDRKIGTEVAQKIAKAFDIPASEVFEIAGLLPHQKNDERADKLAHRINQLPEEDQNMVENFIETLLMKRGNEKGSVKKAQQR